MPAIPGLDTRDLAGSRSPSHFNVSTSVLGTTPFAQQHISGSPSATGTPSQTTLTTPNGNAPVETPQDCPALTQLDENTCRLDSGDTTIDLSSDAAFQEHRQRLFVATGRSDGGVTDGRNKGSEESSPGSGATQGAEDMQYGGHNQENKSGEVDEAARSQSSEGLREESSVDAGNPSPASGVRNGMDKYVLSEWMNASASTDFEAILDETLLAASRDIKTEGSDFDTQASAVKIKAERQLPRVPLNDRELSQLKALVLYKLNQMETGPDFAGLCADKHKNKDKLVVGGFMWVEQIVFIGGHTLPAKRSRYTKYIFTPEGLFMVKLRLSYVENWDKSDMRGYYCFGHGGKLFDEMSQIFQQSA
jgi:hypothetical protein